MGKTFYAGLAVICAHGRGVFAVDGEELGKILTPTGQIFLGRRRLTYRMKQLERLYQYFRQRGVRQFRYVYLNHRRHPSRAIVRLGDAVLVRPSVAPKPKARKSAHH